MELKIDRVPAARGVTHLMYVGDDEAVEKATAGPSKGAVITALISTYVVFSSGNQNERAFAAGFAAYWWWKVYKSRR